MRFLRTRHSSAALRSAAGAGLVAASVCLPGVVGCGISGGESGRVLRVSASAAEGEPQTLALRRFAEEIERRTAGELRVEVYPSSALGDEREVIELVVLGAVQAACPANSPLATFAPELLALELPFLFEDRPHLYRALDGEVGAALGEALRRRGLRLLGFFDIGLRQVMTRESPLETAADFAGLKIRTMENPLHLAAFRSFGASPLPMAYGELYTALEQGVIDGAEAAATNYLSRGFHEVAPFWAEVGWLHLVAPFVMNESFFASLPERHRRAVEAAAAVVVEEERAEYRRQEAEATARLRAAGVRFTHPDRAALRRLSAPVREAPPGVPRTLLDAIEAARTPR